MLQPIHGMEITDKRRKKMELILMLMALSIGFGFGLLTRGVTITINKHIEQPEYVPLDKEDLVSTEDMLPTDIQQYFKQNQGFIK